MKRASIFKKWILIALALLGPRAFAHGQEDLAPGIKALIYAEQILLSRDLNEAKIMTPKANFQDDKYKPENGQVFEVKSYWVAKDLLKTFESHLISQGMKELFYKNENGKESVLLLVHPESESFYANFLKAAQRGPRFWGTSTSSSRTLLMWPDAHPEKAFFGKLSLNKKIGGVVRTIPKGEAARSVGTTDVLSANRSALPDSFTFMPETLSVIPKDFDRGAMIVREIPEDVASGKDHFVPLFSLYADRGDKPPLLAEMIAKSGKDPEEFIREKVIAPFIRQWAELVLIHGISMEPHAQNVLIGLNSRGMPSGQFMHRDFGGFNLQISQFEALNTMLPSALPKATNISEDYHQKFTLDSINKGLEVYFEAGFAFNLDQKLPQWVKAGWIPNLKNPKQKNLFSEMIYLQLGEEFAKLTGGVAQPKPSDFKNNNIAAWVEYARHHLVGKKTPVCMGLFL